MRPCFINSEVSPFRFGTVLLFDICMTVCDLNDRSDRIKSQMCVFARTYSKNKDFFESPGTHVVKY